MCDFMSTDYDPVPDQTPSIGYGSNAGHVWLCCTKLTLHSRLVATAHVCTRFCNRLVCKYAYFISVLMQFFGGAYDGF